MGHSLQDWAVLAVFGVVYLGMFLGGLPTLKLDRTGVALLGAIAVIALTGQTVEQSALAIDLPTIVLLFAFMVVSAQMRLGGFYSAVTQRVGGMPLSRKGLLAALIVVAAALSAVFSNDVICLAMTPVVARLCIRRGLQPLPFLLGLACAANIGSAATLIGNPQNMLIGSVMKLHFADYVRHALPPVALSLGFLWLWLAHGPSAGPGAGPGAGDSSMLRSGVRGPEGEASVLRKSQIRSASDESNKLASSSKHQPPRAGNTGAQKALSAQPIAPDDADADADNADADDGSAMSRPNPYRALSVLLLLVVAGLGGAIWYLLQRICLLYTSPSPRD